MIKVIFWTTTEFGTFSYALDTHNISNSRVCLYLHLMSWTCSFGLIHLYGETGTDFIMNHGPVSASVSRC